MFLGSTMSSETTAAQAGAVGKLRFDPMAMLPFCGYHMADYFAHWLSIGRREGAKLPKVFYVNWFRKDDDGKFLWPGFGENSRVLAWIFRRCEGRRTRSRRRSGCVPPVGEGGIDTDGLDVTEETMAKLLEVDPEGWREQLPQMHEHYAQFGDKLPAELREQLDALERRLRDELKSLLNAARPRASELRRPLGVTSERMTLGFIPSDAASCSSRPAVSRRREPCRGFRLFQRLRGRGWALVPIGVDRRRHLRDPLRLRHRHRAHLAGADRRAAAGGGGAGVGVRGARRRGRAGGDRRCS